MDPDAGPQRVLLKLSGNALSSNEAPFDEDAARLIAGEIARAARTGAQMAIVCGGGNIIRGALWRDSGINRIRADYAGMLATLVNALVLRDHLESAGLDCTHYCAFPVPRMAEVFEPTRCIAEMAAGRVVILAGGTGNPLFTTDTAAALRAGELGADLLIKATRVDGVYSANPETDPHAELFTHLTYQEVLDRGLRVMDWTAVSFCMAHGLPLRVVNYAVEGNIARAVGGEDVGTFVGST
jgi:uridylate kinase